MVRPITGVDEEISQRCPYEKDTFEHRAYSSGFRACHCGFPMNVIGMYPHAYVQGYQDCKAWLNPPTPPA